MSKNNEYKVFRILDMNELNQGKGWEELSISQREGKARNLRLQKMSYQHFFLEKSIHLLLAQKLIFYVITIHGVLFALSCRSYHHKNNWWSLPNDRGPNFCLRFIFIDELIQELIQKRSECTWCDDFSLERLAI